ncbi:MAG: hypothetical protein PHV82_06675 [Victivallaceae bacterium]|nr:hypothetical protein [Victivallaceae bacterium]
MAGNKNVDFMAQSAEDAKKCPLGLFALVNYQLAPIVNTKFKFGKLND